MLAQGTYASSSAVLNMSGPPKGKLNSGSADGINSDKIHGNSTKSEKESGHYTNTHESEKTYSGKGDENRMNQSAKAIENKYGDPVIKQDHTKTSNAKDAYIGEHKRIKANVGVKAPNNYN